MTIPLFPPTEPLAVFGPELRDDGEAVYRYSLTRRAGVDIVGPDNDAWIDRRAAEADLIVCAWGGPHGRIVEERAAAVEKRLRAAGHRLHVLALTKDGIPRHPLMLRADLKPVLWEGTR